MDQRKDFRRDILKYLLQELQLRVYSKPFFKIQQSLKNKNKNKKLYFVLGSLKAQDKDRNKREGSCLHKAEMYQGKLLY